MAIRVPASSKIPLLQNLKKYFKTKRRLVFLNSISLCKKQINSRYGNPIFRNKFLGRQFLENETRCIPGLPGPGGIKGLKVASKLQLVSGNAKKSSPYITVEENPRRGVDVTLDTGLVPFAVPALTLPNLAQDKVSAGTFAPAIGAGLGFDLSNLTGIPELYEKTNMYYVMREPFSSFLIHTGAEKRWLVADSTYVSAAILGAASMVSFKTGNVSEETQTTTTTNGESGESQSSSQDVKKEEEATAQTFGTIFQGGLSHRFGTLSSIGFQGGYQYMGDKLNKFKADSGESVLRDAQGNTAAIDLSGGFLMLDFYLHL